MLVFVLLTLCVWRDMTSKGVTYPTPPSRHLYKGIPVPRVLYHGRTQLAKVSGIVCKSYRTHRSVWYAYELLAEPAEVSGVVWMWYPRKYRAGYKMCYPYPGYAYFGYFLNRNSQEVSGIWKEAVQNSQEVAYLHELLTEPTEVSIGHGKYPGKYPGHATIPTAVDISTMENRPRGM